MPFTTWIRDALGIRKDMVDIKKAKLETEKLEAEKRERDLITPATLEDVRKYDPKTRALLKVIQTIIYVILFVLALMLALAAIGFPNLWLHRSK
jgi:hypothetical protein